MCIVRYTSIISYTCFAMCTMRAITVRNVSFELH